MNALYGATSMCLACESRLPALSAAEPHSKAPGPQYFTFDPLPVLDRAPARRGRKRLRKVLYPPVVKRYYPAKERSQAKRLLFLLLTILFYQIYSAEEDLAQGPKQEAPTCPPASQPPLPAVPLEVPEVANATSSPGGQEPSLDLSQLLEQNPAAF